MSWLERRRLDGRGGSLCWSDINLDVVGGCVIVVFQATDERRIWSFYIEIAACYPALIYFLLVLVIFISFIDIIAVTTVPGTFTQLLIIGA